MKFKESGRVHYVPDDVLVCSTVIKDFFYKFLYRANSVRLSVIDIFNNNCKQTLFKMFVLPFYGFHFDIVSYASILSNYY